MPPVVLLLPTVSPSDPHDASETTSAQSSTLEEDTMKLCPLGPLAAGFLLLLSGNLRDPHVRDAKPIWMSSELLLSSCCLGAAVSVNFRLGKQGPPGKAFQNWAY